MLKRSMSHNLRGVVLSITPYQEHHAMTHFLSKDYGLLRFVLQGFYKPQSKMQAIGMPFAEVSYRTDYKPNRLLKAYGGELHHAYIEQREDYDWLVWMSLLSELIIHNYEYCEHDQLYTDLVDNLESLDYRKVINLVVSIIQGLGIRPYLEGCVVCDDHRIHGFSSELGGFTCQIHSSQKETYEYLVLLGQIFNDKEISTQDDLLISQTIINLVRYLEFHTNIKYHSLELL